MTVVHAIRTPGEAYEYALLLEKASEEFYHLAAEHFAGTDIQMLLLQLAEEESTHQSEIEEMRARVLEEIASDARLETDLAPPARDRLERIARAGSLDEVARIALSLEEAARENYKSLAQAASGGLREMFLEMKAFEEEHIRLLRRMIKDINVDPDDPYEIYEQ